MSAPASLSPAASTAYLDLEALNSLCGGSIPTFTLDINDSSNDTSSTSRGDCEGDGETASLRLKLKMASRMLERLRSDLAHAHNRLSERTSLAVGMETTVNHLRSQLSEETERRQRAEAAMRTLEGDVAEMGTSIARSRDELVFLRTQYAREIDRRAEAVHELDDMTAAVERVAQDLFPRDYAWAKSMAARRVSALSRDSATAASTAELSDEGILDDHNPSCRVGLEVLRTARRVRVSIEKEYKTERSSREGAAIRDFEEFAAFYRETLARAAAENERSGKSPSAKKGGSSSGLLSSSSSSLSTSSSQQSPTSPPAHRGKKGAGCWAHDHPYFLRCIREDVAPCVSFPKSIVPQDDILKAILIDDLALETIPRNVRVTTPDATFACACCKKTTDGIPEYRFKPALSSPRCSWYALDAACRDRLVAACELASFGRNLASGLLKLTPAAAHEKLRALRHTAFISRFGGVVSAIDAADAARSGRSSQAFLDVPGSLEESRVHASTHRGSAIDVRRQTLEYMAVVLEPAHKAATVLQRAYRRRLAWRAALNAVERRRKQREDAAAVCVQRWFREQRLRRSAVRATAAITTGTTGTTGSGQSAWGWKQHLQRAAIILTPV